MIRQPIYALISIVLLAVVIWFVADRLLFLQTAQRSTGKVVSLTSTNSTCGSRRSRHSCTQFHAIVEYVPQGQTGRYRLNLSAGSARGYDQPLSRASMQMNGAVRVAYNPRKPAEAYEDSLFGIWGTPIFIFIFQISSFFVSLTEPRQRRFFR